MRLNQRDGKGKEKRQKTEGKLDSEASVEHAGDASRMTRKRSWVQDTRPGARVPTAEAGDHES